MIILTNHYYYTNDNINDYINKNHYYDTNDHINDYINKSLLLY